MVAGGLAVAVAVSGCSASDASRSAAGASGSAAPESAVVSALPSAPPPAASGVPGVPRVSWKGAGHVVTLSLRPGPGSSQVGWYEVANAARGSEPAADTKVERCDAVAGDGQATQCPLTFKRGEWDVFVRAVSDAGGSDWYQGASAGISSCTDADGVAGVCEVGDTGPGGGVVFLDAGSRQSWGQYLEAAPPGWSGKPSDGAKWWCPLKQPGWNAVLATGEAIGTGAANTQVIIENCGSDTAAGLAAAYRGGGKTDWALPSKGELTAMYDRRQKIPGLTLRNDYWSSSQSKRADLNNFADERDFSDGSQSEGQKDASWGFYVHPVRAF